MTELAITLIKSKCTDDDFVIDATNPSAAGTLKTLRLTWHGSVTNTITSPLTATMEIFAIGALRAKLYQRSASAFDSHLIVSSQIFTTMRTALAANLRLALTIRHAAGTSDFDLECLAPAIVAPDPYLQTISETLQSTGEKVLQLQQDVSSIKELLQSALAGGRTLSAATDNGKSAASYEEYKAERGVGQS